MKKTVKYVNNKDLFDSIVKYKDDYKRHSLEGLSKPQIPDYAVECFFKIANNLATKACFSRYSYKDDMILDGVENCVKYFDTFDPNKTTNPFSYFTQTIYNAFLRKIDEEKRARYVIYKHFTDNIIYQDPNLLVDDDGRSVVSVQMHENINIFMEDFERLERDRKIKRRVAKEEKLLMASLKIPEEYMEIDCTYLSGCANSTNSLLRM